MIADRPEVREAELYGMPPYDDDPDYTEQANELLKADDMLDKVIDLLLDVEDKLKDTEFSNDFRNLIYKVQEIGTDIRCEASRVKGIS